MFFKILINLSDKKFRKLKLTNLFDNLIFYKNKKNWDVEIFTNDLVKDQFFISKLLGLKVVKVEKLKKRSLLSYNKNQFFSTSTKKFEISNFKKETSKINIFIPSSTAFGSGSHPSTFLVIRNLEKIFMKGKFR